MIKNLFKSTLAAKRAPMDIKLKNKTNSKKDLSIIKEIHNSFYTEVDNLLASAKNANSLETDKQQLIDKCERLKSLGFVSTKEVVEAETEISRLSRLSEENRRKEDLIGAINYFSVKYPQYKFITEESVKTICSRYNLVYGESSKYIGTVPDKNLQQMEDFKISENDECYIQESSWGYRELYVNKINISFNNYNFEKNAKHTPYYYGDISVEFKKSPLEIVAPVSDFNMNVQEIENFKLVDKRIEIPDPIVLKQIFYGNTKYYLIVTSWGLEASDENVVNERMS